MAIPGDLYISVDFGSSPTKDNGSRPYTGSNPQWNSSSIWLAGGPNDTQTHVGTPTTIKVRVSNMGESPVRAVRVDAYVMNPHVGLAQPQQAIQRLSGSVGSIAAGSGSTSPSDAHVVTCMIQDPAEGPIPWTPTEPELSGTVNGDGHLCVIANVFADDDGHQLLEGENFNVVDDQHQGQRNIQLLAASKLRPKQAEFLLMPAPVETETRVTIERVDPEIAIGAGERWLLLSHRDISEDCEKGGLVLHHKGKRFPLFLSDAELQVRLTVDDCEESEGWLTPFEQPRRARIRFHLPKEDKLGALHVFEIVQRDCEDRALGALRMLAFVNG
ncbi:hypothetical protein ACFQ6S_07315 [Streptomyces sp. NPDC056479]|uniref:hypothetical protein n=1 Tax=Streptomyces sp. NPDC056479 TaxID=3345832 RepID=UPI003691BEAA